MGCRSGLARTAFEIRHGDDLEVLITCPVTQVARFCLGQVAPNSVDLLQRVGQAALSCLFNVGPLARCHKVAKVAVCDSYQPRRLTTAEAPERLLRLWREEFLSQGLELGAEGTCVPLNNLIDSQATRIAVNCAFGARHRYSRIPGQLASFAANDRESGPSVKEFYVKGTLTTHRHRRGGMVIAKTYVTMRPGPEITA